MKINNLIGKNPAFLLIFASPFIAEVISGSTPFRLLLNPFVSLTYLGFYGLGALIIREIKARKGLTFLSVLFLGTAYGVLEEGILLKSWYDPTWMGGEILSKSLRVGGISPLQLWNVLYHAVFSITLPIFLVESLTESVRPWLSKRWLFFSAFIFVLAGFLLGQFNVDYKISLIHYLFALCLFSVFSLLGLRKLQLSARPKPFSINLAILAFFFQPFLAITLYTFSMRGVAWSLIVLSTLITILFYSYIFYPVNPTVMSKKQRLTIVLGFIAGLIPFAAVQVRNEPEKIFNLLFGLVFVAILLKHLLSIKLFKEHGEDYD